MNALIDFTRIEESLESDFTMTYYAWIEVDRSMTAGTEIVDLKVQNSGTDFTTEKGFREFLTRISILDFDEAQLSPAQIANINAIRMYLLVPIDGDPEGINGSDTIDQQIEDARNP